MRASDGNRALVYGARVLIVVAAVAMWQFLPEIAALRDFSPVFDPFFVSSPAEVGQRLIDVTFGGTDHALVWPYLRDTMIGTGIGVTIGTVAGALGGLLLSNSPWSRRILTPFVTLVNATPRIALIPIFVIIAGPTLTASVLTAVLIVFFIVFYNAYAGGISVPSQALQNAQLLGATSREVMRQVRLPYVLVWTFAALPNAISFGLVGVVTAEILTGQVGMGRLLLNSISIVDSTLTFVVIVVLSVVGVALVTVSELAQRRLLHWWERSL